MALSKSLAKGQIPISCQLCETNNKINWRCDDCKYLMCDPCKITIHPKFAKDHHVVNIRNIGQKKIEFKVVKEYTTELRDITSIAVSPDGSIWIVDTTAGKIQNIKLKEEKVNVLSSFNENV